MNLLDDTRNQPSKFRGRNWLKINDGLQGTQNANSDIKFKTLMIKSMLCNYSDAYIHVKATITVPNTAAAAAPANNTNKKAIFKNCAPFSTCTSGINNTQVSDAQDIDIVVPMFDLIKHSDVYLKILGSLWKY